MLALRHRAALRPLAAAAVSFPSDVVAAAASSSLSSPALTTAPSRSIATRVAPAPLSASLSSPAAQGPLRARPLASSTTPAVAAAAPLALTTAPLRTAVWSRARARARAPPSEETELHVPAGAEGIPFRLSPDDAMEAYSKWFWRKTPFFRPIPPVSTTPIVLPFWCFSFKVTIRHRPSGTTRVIDYDDLQRDPAAFGIFSDARIRASQVYAGYEFTREMVDVLKAPALFAQPWSADFLTPPSHSSHGMFAFRPPAYQSRFDPLRAQAFAYDTLRNKSWGRARETLTWILRPDNIALSLNDPTALSASAAAASRPGELLKGSRRKDGNLDLAYEMEGSVWGWKGRRLIMKERGKAPEPGDESPAESFALMAAELLSTIRPMSTEHMRLVPATPAIGSVETDEFVMTESIALQAAKKAVEAAELMMLRFGGQAAPDGSLPRYPPTSKEAVANAAARGETLDPTKFNADDYEITIREGPSRRLFLPGYKSTYKHMFSSWDVYTSAVTGRSFGLQQMGALESMVRGATVTSTWFGAGIAAQSRILIRFLPAIAAIAATGLGALGMLAKLSPFRVRSRLQQAWSQTRTEELKVQEMLAAHSAQGIAMATEWRGRVGGAEERRHAAEGKAAWEALLRRDAAERARIKSGQARARQWREDAKREEEAAERARRQQREREEARRREEQAKHQAEREREKARENAKKGKAPPEIPNDVYECLGLPRPRTYAQAQAITRAEIRNGYRTQMMKYHPDLYREETAEHSLAYAQLRTQAIVEAHRLIKTDELKEKWNRERYPRS